MRMPKRPSNGRVFAEVHVAGSGRRGQVRALGVDRIDAPDQQNHHHDRGDLHDFHGLFAGFFNALGVFPPVVDGDGCREDRRGLVHRELQQGVIVAVGHDQRQPAVCGADGQHFVHEAGDVLAGRDARDGAGEDVIEHQGGDAQLGEGAAQRLLDDAIDATAGEHRTALDVNCPHGEGKEHDAEDEPGSGLADCLFGDAACIKCRRTQVVENDCGSSPEGNEGEHDRRRHNKSDAIRDWGVSSFRSSHE
jgi:hypothetical protein